MLEQMFELAPVSMGWVDQEKELKAEILEATGKLPVPLAVSQELQLRDMEKKIRQVINTLDGSKRDGGR